MFLRPYFFAGLFIFLNANSALSHAADKTLSAPAQKNSRAAFASEKNISPTAPTKKTNAALVAATPSPLSTPLTIRFCLFDPVGANGQIANMARDLALEARRYNLFVDLKIFVNEKVASDAFKAGQCDGVALTTLRARQFNRITGSIDSPGNVRSYAELITLLRALSHPAFAPMSITGRYQVVGVVPIGALFVMTNDKRINSIEKAAGKRVVVLDWDKSQADMISAIGAQPVPADITTFAGKFNNGEADIIAAPAMAYLPLELYRGIGKEGGVIRFPLLFATGSILIRRDFLLPKVPDLDVRLKQIQHYGLKFIGEFIKTLEKSESDIPKHLWIELPADDQVRYSHMLGAARIHMTKNGVYDTSMMHLLKMVRCKHTPAAAECSTFDE